MLQKRRHKHKGNVDSSASSWTTFSRSSDASRKFLLSLWTALRLEGPQIPSIKIRFDFRKRVFCLPVEDLAVLPCAMLGSLFEKKSFFLGKPLNVFKKETPTRFVLFVSSFPLYSFCVKLKDFIGIFCVLFPHRTGIRKSCRHLLFLPNA